MGTELELIVGAPAAGGACVARHNNRVVFVRHALPGEVVVARVTASGPGGRYWYADAVRVLSASPHRVEPACAVSGAGGCGGCDYQHVDLAEQRRWKAGVIAEQLVRLGGAEADVDVVPVAGDDHGLGWRTRVRFAVSAGGDLGFKRYRSDDVVVAPDCPIAVPSIREAVAGGAPDRWSGAERVIVVDSDSGITVLPRPGPPAPTVTESAAGRSWQVAADGFWQVHPGAADALAALVVRHGAGISRVWDLYCGVGLFAGALARAQARERIDAVEGDRRAAACARTNLVERSEIRVHRSEVGHWILGGGRSGRSGVGLIVLDPPRKGAGKPVLTGIDASDAHRIIYIACDPASLGRDTGWLRERGWRLGSVTGLDIFPMTHHVETVAVFDR